MGEMIGYIRCSTVDQDYEVQRERLKSIGVTDEWIFEEKISGNSLDRPQLQAAIKAARKGDTFVFTRLDRLSRSMKDLTNIMHQLEQKQVLVKATDQAIDTSTPEGKAFWQMLGVFSEFESSIRKARQKSGIEAAKAKGVYKGRKPIDPEVLLAVRDAVASGVPVARACRDHGIGRATYYKNIQSVS